MARFSRQIRARENRAWRRLGPFFYRLRSLMIVIALVGLNCISTLAFVTFGSLYPGTGSIGPNGPSEQTVHVRVEGCRRVGPVSEYGFGIWWECRARLQSGGEGAQVTVGRSIVKPEEIGTVVELRQACPDSIPSNCGYGKPTGVGWQLYYGGLYILGKTLMLMLLASAGVFLLRSILGAPKYFAMKDRLSRVGTRK